MVTTITKLGTWGSIFGRRSKLVKSIAEDLRALMVGLHPNVVEVPRKGEKAVSYGLGEKKMSEAYCYLMPHTGYVNLGFFWGSELDDSNGLLEGKGKKMRHVKVSDVETARSAKIAHLVYLAIEERKTGLIAAVKKKTKKPRNKTPVKRKKLKKEMA